MQEFEEFADNNKKRGRGGEGRGGEERRGEERRGKGTLVDHRAKGKGRIV